MSFRRLSFLVPIFALALVPAGPALSLSPTASAPPPGGCAGVQERDALSAAGAAPRCLPAVHPETFAEMERGIAERAAREAMPFNRVAPGAREHAASEYAYMLTHRDSSIPGTTGTWRPAGQAPLYNDSTSPVYNQSPEGSLSALGYPELSGRLTSFAADPRNPKRWFASSAGGGVWETDDGGASGWRSVGEGLPDQTIGAIGFTTANGGTIIAVSGDNAEAGNTPTGVGAFYSTDDGVTWYQAPGLPGTNVGFKVAVDPTNPNVVYAATGLGLYRSADGGRSWANTVLPTGCTDITDWHCFLANTVTDVVVRSADAGGAGGGKVMAVVGWQVGAFLDPDGKTPQSPNNGIYVSNTGQPGTFTYIDSKGDAPMGAGGAGNGTTGNGFAAHSIIGRTALAIASGPSQDHDVVYAIVQDAQKLQGCIGELGVDVEVQCGTPFQTADPTFLDGAYVTTDFGQTWTRVMDAKQLQAPGSGSALLGIPGYGPGIQSWYNLHIQVDPTMQDATGIPERIVFGLEETWENQLAPVPVGVKQETAWHTISRYWNACLAQVAGIQCNPDAINPGPTVTTTVHPDQHAGLFVPDQTGGGVTYLEGSDGGAWLQHLDAGTDFNNDNWGSSINPGLYTLQAYNFDVAKDGTVIAGNQDNGTQRIDGRTGRDDMIFGGDGFFAGIDPGNSQNMLEEYVGGAVNVSSDGGQHWCSNAPGNTDKTWAGMFSTPVQRDDDPGNANNYLIGGDQIEEMSTGYTVPQPCDPTGNANQNNTWTPVYTLALTTAGVHPPSPAPAPSPTTAPVPDSGTQASAVDLSDENAYAAYCNPCSVAFSGSLSTHFANGIATNVAGDLPPRFGASDGWHRATAAGLPERYVTSIRMDPANPRTVYVTLGGYSVPWIPPGAVGDDVSKVGRGHVYKSVDAGEHFTDISGNLPDAVANWSMLRNGQLIVATDFGVYASRDTGGGDYTLLGSGLPAAQVTKIMMQPGSTTRMYASTYGRGIYIYDFPSSATTASTPSPVVRHTPAPSPSPTAAPLPNTFRGFAFGPPLALLGGSLAIAALLRRRRLRLPRQPTPHPPVS